MKTFIWDGLALAGLALTAGGLWWIYPPVCLVSLGLFLLATAVYGAKLWASSRRSGSGEV